MEAKAVSPNKLETNPRKDNVSVCTSTEECQKLLKFFEIFIRIDKSLKKKNEKGNK